MKFKGKMGEINIVSDLRRAFVLDDHIRRGEIQLLLLLPLASDISQLNPNQLKPRKKNQNFHFEF